MRKHATEFVEVIDAQGVPPVVVLVGGEEVIEQEHALPRLDGVLMDGDGGFAVLEGVTFLDGFVRELALLTNWDKGGV